MEKVLQGGPLQLVEIAPDEPEVFAVDELVAVGSDQPDQHRHIVGQVAEAVLALAQGLFGPLAVRDIDQHVDRPHQLVVVVPDGTRMGQHRHPLPVGSLDDDFSAIVGRLLPQGQSHPAFRVLDRSAIAGVELEGTAVSIDRVVELRCTAPELLGLLVVVGDEPVAIAEIGARRHPLQHPPQPALTLLDGVFGALAGGDVFDHRDETIVTAGGVAQRGDGHVHPYHRAVGTQVALLGGEFAAYAAAQVLHQRLAGGPIVGMGDLGALEANELRHARPVICASFWLQCRKCPSPSITAIPTAAWPKMAWSHWSLGRP